MPIMKSIDGRLYNMPDENAAKYLIPADKVAETLKEAGVQTSAGAGSESQQPGQMQAYGGGHHGGHHGGGGPGWWGFGAGLALGAAAASYNNYFNYQNYANYSGW